MTNGMDASGRIDAAETVVTGHIHGNPSVGRPAGGWGLLFTVTVVGYRAAAPRRRLPSRREVAMSHRSLLLSSLLLLASACATSSASNGGAPLQSQSRAASAPADKPTATAQDDKLICQTERPVGSNIPKRVCRTQAEIDREREAAQDKMRELSRTTQKKLE
jgi:hypothetical protein